MGAKTKRQLETELAEMNELLEEVYDKLGEATPIRTKASMNTNYSASPRNRMHPSTKD